MKLLNKHFTCAAVVFLGAFTYLPLANAENQQDSDVSLSCDFAYMGAPFATVAISVTENGAVRREGTVTMYGRSQTTAIEQQEALAGEKFHVLVDADRPGQELTMIVFDDDAVATPLRAKLINPQSPMVKEMDGTCEQRP